LPIELLVTVLVIVNKKKFVHQKCCVNGVKDTFGFIRKEITRLPR